MPFETVLVVTGVLVVFAIFALIVAYVDHIASGQETAWASPVVDTHMPAHSVRRADEAPDLVRRSI